MHIVEKRCRMEKKCKIPQASNKLPKRTSCFTARHSCLPDEFFHRDHESTEHRARAGHTLARMTTAIISSMEDKSGIQFLLVATALVLPLILFIFYKKTHVTKIQQKLIIKPAESFSIIINRLR